MSTATNKGPTDSTPLSTADRVIVDLVPDDKLELMKEYQLIKKIRNAASDREGLSLLIKAIEEDPTLLHEIKTKGILLMRHSYM